MKIYKLLLNIKCNKLKFPRNKLPTIFQYVDTIQMYYYCIFFTKISKTIL